MPLGADDYDVVIGVEVSDQTGPGLNSVRKNIGKTSDDLRKYGDKQAQQFSRTTQDLLSKTDQHVTRSSHAMINRLTTVFDRHNFLLRNMARQAGSTTGAIAIGVGKLALSYRHLGDDANKTGTVLEKSLTRQIENVRTAIQKAQANFDSFKTGGSKSAEAIAGKINEVSTAVSTLLGGAKVDAPFFKSFIKARNETDKYLLVLDKLGPKAALAYSQNQQAIEKLATTYTRLEARATRAFKLQGDRANEAAGRVTKYKKELDALERALLKVQGGSDAAAAATGGFSSKLGAIGITAGAALVVILALVAAVAGLTYGIYRGATAAAKYGDEIYKLSLSTGLTVKTLSALSIIARETSTDVDSLAKTFTRTQIQVQRGLDKPFSEAGRALRTLRVNFQELRKANPDQQVFMLAKAFTELNNQNVRATVSQQLFSRDAERQAKMLEQVANGFTIAQQKAKKFGLELDETGAVKAHMATVAVTDLKLAWEGLWVSLGIKILPQLTQLMESFVDVILRTGGAFDTMAGMATFALREIRIGLELVKEGGFTATGLGMSLATGGLQRAEAIVNKQDVERTQEYMRRAEELRRRGLQGDDQYAAGKGPKTPLDRLEEQVKRLRFEIQAIQDIGSRTFRLRFELEELQKVKSAFESIFKLRNQMGLTMDEPVPQFRVFGTPEEQRQDLTNIQSYLQQMERMKDVFDGVRRAANEQSDALAELARVQQEALMPVVDAGTLAEIKYQKGLRDRAKAEKELTADVIAETKLREVAIQDEVGTTLKAYMSLQRDIGRSQDAIRGQRAEDDLFVKILRGGPDAEAAIRASLQGRIGETAPPVIPTELMTIAAHAATIDLNVASIAEKIGANVHNVSNTTLTSSKPDVDYAVSRLVRRNPDGTVTILREEDISDKFTDTVKTQTTDPGFLRNRILKEAKEKAEGERSTEDRRANQEILDNQARMNVALINLETDYARKFSAIQLIRRQSVRDTILDIMTLENDFRDLQNQNSDLYKDIHLRAIREIQEASNQATESIIQNQIKIADSTVYHAEIANAAVMEFLANQRTITDVIADAKISVIDGVFGGIDSALDRFTDKLGFAGDLVKDILSGFIRLALTPFFKAAFGQGGGGGGGIFGGIFGTGGGIPGLPGAGPGGTPPFNPGALLGLGGNISPTVPGSITGSDLPIGPGGGGPAAILRSVFGTGATSTVGLGSRFMTGLRSLGPVLPFIGAGIGATAGGTSRFGTLLGGAGGLLAGAAGFAALSGGFTGALLGGPFATTGIFGSMGPGIASLLTNPFTAVAAGGLIVGALLLRRNAQRREEEVKRDVVSRDTGTRLWQILELVKTDQMDGIAARAEIEELHAKWIEFGNTIKDSKTRRHHFDTWNHFQFVIDNIHKAADEQIMRENNRRRMVPVFASGGWSHESQLIKVRPGEGVSYPGSNVVRPVFGKDKGYDSEFMYVPKGTRIYNKSEMDSSEGFETGGIVGMGSSRTLHISDLTVAIDGDGLASVVIKSPYFKDAVIDKVHIGKKQKKIA